jgi:hypothetical protein
MRVSVTPKTQHYLTPFILGTIGSIPLKDPNFRYIPWTPHVIDSCRPTCK